MGSQNTACPELSIAEVMALAERICNDNGVRLTDQRRKVLEILCVQHKPVGAYEILEKLSESVPSAKPPTVYRALDFLLEQGLVHRLESLNAFVGCTHLDHPHASQFLICKECGVVQELEDRNVSNTLGRAVEESGFEVDTQVIEITGRCAECQQGYLR